MGLFAKLFWDTAEHSCLKVIYSEKCAIIFITTLFTDVESHEITQSEHLCCHLSIMLPCSSSPEGLLMEMSLRNSDENEK